MRLRQEVQALPRRAHERRVAAARLADILPRPKPILVVAAVLRDGEGRVLIAQRPAGRHLAGRWEFPGGKVGAGEGEHEALARELREELGIELLGATPFMRTRHAYDDRSVELSLWRVERFNGTPQPLDGQQLKWVAPALLPDEDLLEADRPFVAALANPALR